MKTLSTLQEHEVANEVVEDEEGIFKLFYFVFTLVYLFIKLLIQQTKISFKKSSKKSTVTPKLFNKTISEIK